LHQRCLFWSKVLVTLLPQWDRFSSREFRFSQRLFWSWREAFVEYRRKWAKGDIRAILLGIRDYWLGRYGNQETTLKSLL